MYIKSQQTSYDNYTISKCLKTNKSNAKPNCIKIILLKRNFFADDHIKIFAQKSILMDIRKTTSFRSLRLNYWNITQVISTSFSRSTCNLIQSYLLKKQMYQASATDVLLRIYEFFKTAEAADGGVQKGVHRNFAIFTGKSLCWSLLQACKFIKRLQHRCFPVNIAKFLRTSIWKSI